MKITYNNIFYWLPRVLAIFSITFLGLFALDVFEPGKPILYIISALLIHLIPNYILMATLVIAWKYELLGGALFIIIALLMALTFRNPFFINLSIFAPIMLIGALFLVDGYLYQRGGEI